MHHEPEFLRICEAEEALRVLEQEGVTDGTEYNRRCAELFQRLELARRLRTKEATKVWIQ